MDNATLVGPDLEKGHELLQTLDRDNVKVNVLLSAYLSEYEDWRLVAAGRQLDAMGWREAYRVLFDSLASAGFTVPDTPPIMMLPMAHSFIKDLRRRYGNVANGSRVYRSGISVRIFKQVIGDHWVEEAYAYRIS